MSRLNVKEKFVENCLVLYRLKPMPLLETVAKKGAAVVIKDILVVIQQKE